MHESVKLSLERGTAAAEEEGYKTNTYFEDIWFGTNLQGHNGVQMEEELENKPMFEIKNHKAFIIWKCPRRFLVGQWWNLFSTEIEWQNEFYFYRIATTTTSNNKNAMSAPG